MTKRLLLPALCAWMFSSGGAQTIRRPDGKSLGAQSIERIVRQLMDTAGVTGLSLGIINEGRIAYLNTFGVKDSARRLPLDTATCLYAASFAKPLFACLVMQLVKEGRIDLDKPLFTYLPKPIPAYEYFRDLEGDDRWKLITARHCLSHTTGFPNWRFLNPKGNRKLEIFFTPGARYAYSGEGLVLLQMTIEAITGRKLEDLAQERIFRPLNMRRTSFVWQPAFENNYAVGFDTNEEALKKVKRNSANAAGSMETTIADFSRFMVSVLKPGNEYGEMFTPQVRIHTRTEFPSLNNDTTDANQAIDLSYGLGWGLFRTPYGKAFFKEGHDDGWEHYLVAFPATRSCFIIMTNSSNGESIFKELVERLAGITIPWEWEGYTPYRATVKLPESVLAKYVGVYEGRLRALVTLENGKLKVESETVGLARTTLYPSSDRRFFLKIMQTEVEFVEDGHGKVIKAVLDDEGEHYELRKTQ